MHTGHERLFGGVLVFLDGNAQVVLHDRLHEIGNLYGSGVDGLALMLELTKSDLEHYVATHGMAAIKNWRSQFDGQVELGAVVESRGRNIDDFARVAFLSHSFIHHFSHYLRRPQFPDSGG